MTRKDYGLQEKSAMSSDPQRAHEWYLKNRLIKGNLPEKNFIDHLSKLMVHFTKDAGETR